MRLAAVLLSFVCFTSLIADEEHVLTVTGKGRQMVNADMADVRIGIEESASTAKAVQDAIGMQMKPVLQTLSESGAQDVKTSGFSVYPEYSKGGARVIVGYRGDVTFSFSSEVSEVGELIDAAMTSGANKVHGINVRPRKELMAAAREGALRSAAKKALEEARFLLDELGLQEEGIYQITVDPGHHNPMYKSMAMETHALTVLPEEQEVTASVTLRVEFRG